MTWTPTREAMRDWQRSQPGLMERARQLVDAYEKQDARACVAASRHFNDALNELSGSSDKLILARLLVSGKITAADLAEPERRR